MSFWGSLELIEFIYSVRVLYHPFATFFTPHFAFLEKIINKEYPDPFQDGERQALDGRLPTLFKPHKDRDGLQGDGVSRVGSILGDNLSGSDGYGDDRIDRVAGHNPMLP